MAAAVNAGPSKDHGVRADGSEGVACGGLRLSAIAAEAALTAEARRARSVGDDRTVVPRAMRPLTAGDRSPLSAKPAATNQSAVALRPASSVTCGAQRSM